MVSYAYLDAQDRMVLVDGSQCLLRLSHSADGRSIRVDERIDLSRMLAQSANDAVVGLVPDWSGRIWVVDGRTATLR